MKKRNNHDPLLSDSDTVSNYSSAEASTSQEAFSLKSKKKKNNKKIC